jgi:hypothetical protein
MEHECIAGKADRHTVLGLQMEIADGCRLMWDVYEEAAQEWQEADDELLRTVVYEQDEQAESSKS